MRRIPLLAFVAAAIAACTSPPAEVIQLGVGERVFTVEVVRTREDQARGLMNRNSLAPDAGMLFAYDNDANRDFWMKNTRIPLSIAFISSDGRITEIRDMRPHSLDTITSRLKVRYALEVNQGAFAQAGVVEGDYVRFPEGFR